MRHIAQGDLRRSPPRPREFEMRRQFRLHAAVLSTALLGIALAAAPASAQKKYDTGATGATKWGDPEHFPWTMGWAPTYQAEGRIYAKYVLQNKPDGKIAIMYQNDDYGKDYLKGLKDGLGDKAAKMIIIEESYEVSEPTIDSHIVKLKSSGADIFYNVTTPKFTAQAIKKMAEI